MPKYGQCESEKVLVRVHVRGWGGAEKGEEKEKEKMNVREGGLEREKVKGENKNDRQ